MYRCLYKWYNKNIKKRRKEINMERLQQVLNTQKQLQNRLGKDISVMGQADKTALIKDNVYFVTEELHEMARELPYVKDWKDYSGLTDVDIANRIELAKKEFADVFTFLMNIAIALGIDASELYNLYFEKNSINHKRQDDGYKEEA